MSDHNNTKELGLAAQAGRDAPREPSAAELKKDEAPANETAKSKLASVFGLLQGVSTDRWIALVAAVAAIAAIIVSHVDSGQTHEDFTQLRAVFVTTKGDLDYVITLDNKPYPPPKGSVRVQFWTPSVQTKESLKAKEWEKLANDDKLNEFGRELVGQGVARGYRRYDVTGLGLGGQQKGTWWVASGPFKFVEFLRLYHEIWHPGADEVYMEVSSGEGGHSR